MLDVIAVKICSAINDKKLYKANEGNLISMRHLSILASMLSNVKSENPIQDTYLQLCTYLPPSCELPVFLIYSQNWYSCVYRHVTPDNATSRKYLWGSAANHSIAISPVFCLPPLFTRDVTRPSEQFGFWSAHSSKWWSPQGTECRLPTYQTTARTYSDFDIQVILPRWHVYGKNNE